MPYSGDSNDATAVTYDVCDLITFIRNGEFVVNFATRDVSANWSLLSGLPKSQHGAW